MSGHGTGNPRPFERVFLLEASGPTLELLRERADRLPNIGRMLDQGAWARLRGPLQPVTPVSFATLYTGKNPGQTGLYDYFLFPAGGYERVPCDRTALRAEPFFQTLSDRGLRVGLLNAPLLHPLPPIDGFAVSGDEGVGEDFARPEDVGRLLAARGYSVPFGASYSPGREEEFHRHTLRVFDMRREAFRELFGQRPWDFGMLTFHLFGELLHTFWRFYDPRHPRHRPLEEVFGDGDPWLEALVRLDGLVGEVMELTGPRGLVLFAGAWGHRLEHSRLYLNALLQRAGYLKLRRRPAAVLKRLVARSGLSLSAAERLAHRLNLWKLFHYGLPRGKRNALKSAAFLSLNDVDWQRTRAVALGYLGQIYLNVRGHRPFGTIDPVDYEAERERLRRLLEDVRDPRDGERVVERVYPREEIYSGSELPHAPDLVVQLREGWAGRDELEERTVAIDEAPASQSSEHFHESALLVWGQGVPAGEIDARLEDIAPTVLRAFGLPAPPGCDGEPLPIFGRFAPGS